ncbi:hypothetical protein [Bacillus badius]|uniref:hypothetical protein n=1 Tax=Bacillus badius TaxID=1455 RepID=UPI000596E711|nr:hypothetical protein [Bacillus badius]KIL74653.1 hypothetical protein SD78_1722 [Bacillus badius]
MLYKDRKMVKWQGFLLSEHAEQPRTVEEEIIDITIDEQQKELFDRILSQSHHLKVPVTITLNTFGGPYIKVTGTVQLIHNKPGFFKVIGKGIVCGEDIISIEWANQKKVKRSKASASD